MNGASDLGGASDIGGRVSLKRRPAIAAIGSNRSFSKPISKMFPRKAKSQINSGEDIPVQNPIGGQQGIALNLSNPMLTKTSRTVMSGNLPQPVMGPTGPDPSGRTDGQYVVTGIAGNNPIMGWVYPGDLLYQTGNTGKIMTPMQTYEGSMSPSMKSQQITTKSQMKNMFSNASGMKPFAV